MEAGANFSFGGGCHDVAQDVADNVDGSIERWVGGCGVSGRLGTEEEETSSTSAGFGFGEVGCIAVNVEAHVTGMVTNGGIRVRGSVVEQVDCGFGGGFGALGLSGGEAAKGDKHGVVNGTGIVEENAHNLADPGGCGGVQRGRGVRSGHLDFGSILGKHMFVGAIGGGWISVAKTFKGSGNIAGHGEFDRALGVVPVKVEATELGSGPVNGDGVVLAEGGDEKVGSWLANILDAKVIDNESKHDGFGGVDEEAGGVASLDETSRGEFAHKLLVGQEGGLGKAVHSAVNLDVDKTIAGKRGKIVLVYDALGKGGKWDSSKLSTFHFRGGEKEIFNVRS